MGATGAAGATGTVGAQGYTGVAGATGVGITGSTGPKGDTGEKGDTGDTGPAGADGIDGVAGGIGPRGLQGDKGDTGEAGPAGVKGDQGIQGIKGDKGDTGDQGIKGDTGDTGATGAAGANGANVVHRLWSPVSGLTVSVTAFGTQVDLNNVTWTNSGSSNMINLIFSNVASGLKLNTINVYADTSVYTTADNFFECFWPEPFGGTTLPTSTIPTLTWYNSLGQVQSPTGWVWSHVSSGSQIVLFHVPGPNKAFYFRVGVL